MHACVYSKNVPASKCSYSYLRISPGQNENTTDADATYAVRRVVRPQAGAREVEKATLAAAVMSTSGGMGKEI